MRPAVWARTCQFAVAQANYTKAEVHTKVASFIQYATMSLTVQERVGVLHLKYRQYIAHQRFVQGLTEQEADAKWNAYLRDLCIKRTGTSEKIELAVAMPR